MTALIPAILLAVSTSLIGLGDYSVVDQVTPQVEVVDDGAMMSLPAEDPTMGSCWNCKSDSDGACAKQSGKVRMQCEGSRADCTKKGCKIGGSSSCSSAGNVGKC